MPAADLPLAIFALMKLYQPPPPLPPFRYCHYFDTLSPRCCRR